MRAVVTGATGFIGGYLVRALVARGDSVTAIVRTPDRAQHLKELGVTLVGGDVTEPATLEGPMRRADALFHLAAWYEIGVADRTRMYQINVRGTEHVLRAAADAGVARILHCSTVAVLGRHPTGDISNETTVRPSVFTSSYEETKWLAHQRAMDAARDGMPIVIAMPSVVYGPGDRSPTSTLLRLYARGWLFACPYQDASYSWVNVEDLAEGMLLAFDKGRVGQEYILGGENLSLRDLFRTLEPATGIRPPRVEVPGWMMRAAQPLSPVIGSLFHGGPKLVQEGLASMRGSWMVFSTKAERELGYAYRSVVDAMPQTIEWFKER